MKVAERASAVGARQTELERSAELVAKLEGDKSRLKASVSEAKERLGSMTQSALSQKLRERAKGEEVSSLQQRLGRNAESIRKLQGGSGGAISIFLSYGSFQI